MTGYDGVALDLGAGRAVASNGVLHDALVAAVSEARRTDARASET